MSVFYEILNKQKGSTIIFNVEVVRTYTFGTKPNPVDLSGYNVILVLNSKIISYNGNLQQTVTYTSEKNPNIINIQGGNILMGIDTISLKYDLYDCTLYLSSPYITLPILLFQIGFSSTLASTSQATIVTNTQIQLSEQEYKIISTNSINN